MKFALNRHDTSSISAYSEDVARAKSVGWDAAFLPDSHLRRRDTYVLLAAAARSTQSIQIGTLLTNPITRHPAVTASSISTVAELAPGRTLLTCGIGDTAVRLSGLKPATVRELEESIHLIKSLLSGRPTLLGDQQNSLPFAQPVPVWVGAAGPKTLEMSGACADGVFIRVGTDMENIRSAVASVHGGAKKVGRFPSDVDISIVLHTILVEDSQSSLIMGKSIAAGYYEYSPALFDNLDLKWKGPNPRIIKKDKDVFPDFHHADDLMRSGQSVDFSTMTHASSFALIGNTKQITDQLSSLLKRCVRSGIRFKYVVLQPIPNPPSPDAGVESFLERVPRDVLSAVNKSLANEENCQEL